TGPRQPQTHRHSRRSQRPRIGRSGTREIVPRRELQGRTVINLADLSISYSTGQHNAPVSLFWDWNSSLRNFTQGPHPVDSLPGRGRMPATHALAPAPIAPAADILTGGTLMADWRKLAKELTLADGRIDTKETNILRKELFADGRIDKSEL